MIQLRRHSRGCIEERAIDIKEPAMVTAVDPLRLVVAELQRCPSVGAVRFEKPYLARTVTEYDQLLAHDAESTGEVLWFCSGDYGVLEQT